MTYPGAPTHVHDLYRYGPLDQETQMWLFFKRQPGSAYIPIGYIADDSMPDLDKYIATALPIAAAKGWRVFVLVGPGNAGLHHKGCVNFLETYWKCSGIPLRQWIRYICRRKKNRYGGYVMAKRYGLQDMGGGPGCVPTDGEYLWLRRALHLLNPPYGLFDY